MTPYDLSRELHRELAPVAPRLAAALNRALVDLGEGSVLVGLPHGLSAEDDAAFDEHESIDLQGTEAAHVLSRITQALTLLENHSSWRVIVDKGRLQDTGHLELRYTLFRQKSA